MLRKQASLVDGFHRIHDYLRISLTERCNLRCAYCMPADGVQLTPSSGLLSHAEIVHLVRVFASLGVTKVRLTGGEPLLFGSIVQLCRDLRRIPGIDRLAITTNGLLLARMLPDLQAAGLTAVNISLDTLDEEKYARVTRRHGVHRALQAIDAAESMGYDPVKVNCVLLKGVNEDELASMAALTATRPIDVRFIEFMPFSGNQWTHDKVLSFLDAMSIVEANLRARLAPAGCDGSAKLFRVPGHRGRIGFITSATSLFCGSCNRLRLTADGNFKVCLFDDRELSLRDALRAGATEAELAQQIRAQLLTKQFAHGGRRSLNDIAAQSTRPMVRIGG